MTVADALVELQRKSRPGWALEHAGDRLGQELSAAALRTERADDAVLSEEGTDDGSRLGASRVWVIDPLDGSAGFGSGNPEWAVHVALVIDGNPTAGAVAVPGLGVVGATLEHPEVPSRDDGDQLTVVTGHSRSWTDGARVASALGGELLSCGSAGFKAMLVASGQADVYVHDAPLYEWDVCAPVAVAAAAGLHVSDAYGANFEFNQPFPVVRGLVICRPELAADVLALVGRS